MAKEFVTIFKIAVTLVVAMVVLATCMRGVPAEPPVQVELGVPSDGPELPCPEAEVGDNYTITILDQYGEAKSSGDVPVGAVIKRTFTPGEYYIGMTLGENVNVSLETNSLEYIMNSCETTQWIRVVFSEDTVLEITNKMTQSNPTG